VALAFLVGLVGGIGLALMREYLDNTVKTPDDVETLSRLPSSRLFLSLPAPMGPASAMASCKVSPPMGTTSASSWSPQHLPKSQMAESLSRPANFPFCFRQADHPPQVILVTSALSA